MRKVSVLRRVDAFIKNRKIENGDKMTRREWQDVNDMSASVDKKYWVSGREFGRNATARCGRCVRPTEVIISDMKTKYGNTLEFRRVSAKTGKALSTKVAVYGAVQIFDTKAEAEHHWNTRNNELAIRSLEEAGRVAQEYLEAFDKFNVDSGKYQMNREDALAIMKIL